MKALYNIYVVPDVYYCNKYEITVAHRGHAANRIIAVTSFKLQKLYYYCSN